MAVSFEVFPRFFVFFVRCSVTRRTYTKINNLKIKRSHYMYLAPNAS